LTSPGGECNIVVDAICYKAKEMEMCDICIKGMPVPAWERENVSIEAPV